MNKTALIAAGFAVISFGALADEDNPIPAGMEGISLSGGWTYDSPGWQSDDSTDDDKSKDNSKTKKSSNKTAK